MTTVGYPIRRSPGELHGSYPGLIAALRVLHRLLMPRHPLCALVIFNQSLNLFASCLWLLHQDITEHFSVCVQFSKNSPDLHSSGESGGPDRTRTYDPRLIKAVL